MNSKISYPLYIVGIMLVAMIAGFLGSKHSWILAGALIVADVLIMISYHSKEKNE